MVAQDGSEEAIGRRGARGQAQGEMWHKEQGERVARTDALTGGAYAALLIAFLLLVLSVWSFLK
jgi:hypothetical protein